MRKQKGAGCTWPNPPPVLPSQIFFCESVISDSKALKQWFFNDILPLHGSSLLPLDQFDPGFSSITKNYSRVNTVPDRIEYCSYSRGDIGIFNDNAYRFGFICY